ncbi:helix-turn-helix domain-containing protein [Megasphaera elsdenii]|uniref:helix-turn-helix domain-containing protein n=1 Tax=Megasphaera elsdenii TaxID=907 RepID=UPI00339AF473
MKNLKRFREQRGYTQEELAHRAGISRVTISKLESGKQKTTTNTTILALAQALDVPAGDLV